MSDKLSKLIQTVFDNLESLDEKKFKENLSSYYEDPLTEILSNANRLIDNTHEPRHIPLFRTDNYDEYGMATILAADYHSMNFESYVQFSGESLTYSNILTEWVNGYTVHDYFRILTSHWTLNGVTQISKADNYDVLDQDYLWAEAA